MWGFIVGVLQGDSIKERLRFLWCTHLPFIIHSQVFLPQYLAILRRSMANVLL